MASKVMIVRHAEKPTGSSAPFGVHAHGHKDEESLIVDGWNRAGALACLFAPAHGPLQNDALATPDFLYASGTGPHSHSRRPQQTIAPLSARIGKAIHTGYHKAEHAQMVSDALSREGVVLISWQHELIPAIANQILGDATTAPQTWPSERYDLVWVFDRDPAGGGYAFQQIPQCLLAGDEDCVIT